MNATHTTKSVRRKARNRVKSRTQTRGSLTAVARLIGTGVPNVMRWRDGTLPTAAMARLILEKLA
jgi:hypothetical protein